MIVSFMFLEKHITCHAFQKINKNMNTATPIMMYMHMLN
mgnify:CR=1 FL=1